ncbi:MAG: site-2 protease family protein [Thermoproteota archaeon]
MNLDLLPFALLLAVPPVVYTILRLTKKRSERVEASPLHIIIRTRALNRFLNEVPKRHKMFTSFLSHSFLVIFPCLVAVFFFLFGSNLLNLISRPADANQVSLVIPGVTLGLRELPYVTVALFVGVALHELAHGVIGSSKGIPIKSIGIGMFLSLGFALVEFEDDSFKSVERWSRIRAIAAGPSANVIASIFMILLIGSLASGARGIVVLRTSPPASLYLKEWDIITKINDTEILSEQVFRSYMTSIKPGDMLVVHTTDRIFYVRAGTNPFNSSRGFLGISATNYIPILDIMGLKASYNLILLMNWINLANLSLAVVNVAPISPLDGGKIIDELLSNKKNFYIKAFKLAIFTMAAIILVGNFVLSAYRFGL